MEASSVSRTPSLSLPRSRRLLAALSDDRLVEQVRRGNDAAFEAIYDRHARGILGFCRHMLASVEEAEDAVQHTFIQAHGSIRGSARELKLKAWLYAIARNRCISILRARREQAAELHDVPTAGLSEEVQQRSDLRELLADLRELPEDQRAALVLSEVGDLSHAEIATVVGCEVTRVKALVFQARSSLIETRNARAIPCHEIREQLATATGGVLRRGPLRRHLKHCEGCGEFAVEVRRQRVMLAAALPVLPTLALKKGALAAIGLGGGGGAAGGGAAGGAAGGIASLVASGGTSKAIALLAVAGATAAGGLMVGEQVGQGSADRGGPVAGTPTAGEGTTQPASRAPAGDRNHVVSDSRTPRGVQAGSGPSKRNRDGRSGHPRGRGHDGRTPVGRGHTRANGPGSATPPANPGATSDGNSGPNAGPPASRGGGGKPHTNNGRHLGAVRGHGHGNAYGHTTPPGHTKPDKVKPDKVKPEPAPASPPPPAPADEKPEKVKPEK
jgi:RNA polymerase sigma factor (sigma-70 family)